MIDIAFSKLAIIGVAALVFIGPEKLPKVARMAGSLFGRAQRYINQVKSEVNREMELDELRKLHENMQDAAAGIGQTISQSMSETESAMQGAWDGVSGSEHIHADPLREPPASDQSAAKAKDFRKKKMARTSAVPSWYKRQSGQKSRIISGAARVAKYRPAGVARKSSMSFHD
jgi:sec-independent protein translocase protein TatB